MTKTDIVELFGMICAFWPRHSSDFAKAGAPTVNAWHLLLGDTPKKHGELALAKLAALNTFPPNANELLRVIAEIEYPDDSVGADEAWGIVLRAVREYGYNNGREAMDSMPPVVAQTVRDMGWLELCMSENISVDRGQFRRAYEARVQRRKDDIQLPAGLQKSIEAFQKQKAIGAAGNVIALEKASGENK